MQHITEPLSQVFSLTAQIVEALADRDYTRFICGGATGFDTIAATCVLNLREKRPGIQLILALPCADQSSRWSESERRLYEEIYSSADHTVTLSARYYKGCMMVRNKYMVEHASFCVAYYHGRETGGTLSTIRMAVRQGLPVLNIAIPDEARLFLRETAGMQPLPF